MLKELLLKDSASSAIFNKKTQAGKTETIDKENHQKHANTVSIQ